MERGMKFSSSADFTKFPVARRVVAEGEAASPDEGIERAELAHDERHLRRRALTLKSGERILVDLSETVALRHGDRLALEDGRQIEIAAAAEELLEIAARDRLHLTELAWHLGNRHLAAEIHEDRILVLRDHVIKAMLEGLGADVRETVAPFHPMRGAYGSHTHGHGGHTHD
jgi:urease accessory protein